MNIEPNNKNQDEIVTKKIKVKANNEPTGKKETVSNMENGEAPKRK